mgnify:CR=1 FL=1
MKVLILSVADKRHMPMVAVYEKYFRENNIDYDIIRTSRYNKPDNLNPGVFEFEWIQSVNVPKKKKILPFLKFRHFAKRIIKDENYDFIVVWNENTAILFSDLLTFQYKGRYCINVRDQSDKKLYQICINTLVKKSCFSTIPSPSGMPDNNKYIVLYNRDDNLLNFIEPKVKLDKIDPITISFLGFYYRAPKAFLRICKYLGNDKRFELLFAGQGFDTDMKSIIGNKYSNVILEGPFEYEKTAYYLKKTNIINSYYYSDENDDMNIRNAVGIKESYIPMLYMPGVIDRNTYWGEVNKQYGFCFPVDESKINNLADELYEWYMGLDFEELKKSCDRFNNMIDESRKELFNLCDHFILEKNS